MAGLCWVGRGPRVGAHAGTFAGTFAGLHIAVADGVTQGAVGDVAAQALVRHWLAGKAPGQTTQDFLQAAEPAVAQAVLAASPHTGAATGAAAWLAADGSGAFTRVGDCRVLLLARSSSGNSSGSGITAATNEWQCTPLARDQSFGHLYPDVVAQAPPGALDPNQPAHMVGCQRLGTPEWLPLVLASGELLLLCSDGLHTLLSNAQIAAHFASHLPPGQAFTEVTLQCLANALVKEAQALGGEDDITALVVAYRPA